MEGREIKEDGSFKEEIVMKIGKYPIFGDTRGYDSLNVG